MRAKVLERTAAEFKVTVGKYARKELVAQAGDLVFIVKARCNSVYCSHNANLEKNLLSLKFKDR